MADWAPFFTVFVGIPLLVMWGAAIVDIFRRTDLSWVRAALWIVLLLVLPIIGFIVYLAARPRTAVIRGGIPSQEKTERIATVVPQEPNEAPGGVDPRGFIH